MGTDKNFGTIADQQTTGVLTTTFGDNSAGWTTEGMDVSKYDFVQFKAVYAAHASGSLLTFKPLAADRAAADLDAYAAILQDPDADGSLTELEVSLVITANGTWLLPLLDVRGISMLRMAAKIDNATSSPTLTLSYVGHQQAGGVPDLTAPAVSN